ncbi:hypothetical protein BAE44_0020727 [Dichanthelium oligosanthes]|uniref:Malonyl-CoA:ACP transacylase (MAT) domain-containing protein n=1 Tax=Dichanthelium oligosanthes TaxID=888268 RepID=A0A1E5UZP1_9POAL|nr:hypothetical protein BAE44_0020727 [Dichanthelium oligosanthes]
MASTLAILRPSAAAPLMGPRTRVSAPTTAWVALPSRSRYSSTRVSLGSEGAVGSNALFTDYKPATAFSSSPARSNLDIDSYFEIRLLRVSVNGAQTIRMGAKRRAFQQLLNCLTRQMSYLDISKPLIAQCMDDLLDLWIDAPKKKLDSTMISHAYKIYTLTHHMPTCNFEDELKLVKLKELKGEAMQDASNADNSVMVCVISLDSEKVQQLRDAANEEVRLAVAGAFHTSFMQPAVSRLESALATTEIRTSRIPVISNVDAQPHSDPDTIKQILALQVTSHVQWETTVKTLTGKGLERSYELGPKKVTAGILKKINKGASIFCIIKATSMTNNMDTKSVIRL